MSEQHQELVRRRPTFDLGQPCITPGGIVALEFNGIRPSELLHCHGSGDWGNLSEDDKRLNDEAVRNGGRILSAYELADGQKVWVLTEADRSTTTILTPDEY